MGFSPFLRLRIITLNYIAKVILTFTCKERKNIIPLMFCFGDYLALVRC